MVSNQSSETGIEKSDQSKRKEKALRCLQMEGVVLVINMILNTKNPNKEYLVHIDNVG